MVQGQVLITVGLHEGSKHPGLLSDRQFLRQEDTNRICEKKNYAGLHV
jgi:hypothetical protein